MAFMDLVKERYSSRKYRDEPVPREDIDYILEAGRLAPTGKNLQPATVLVASTPEAIHTLERVGKCAGMYGATLALVVVVDTTRTFVRPFDGKNFADIDASIVTTQMMYAAQERGLGSVWVGYFDPAALKAELGLGENEEVSAILAVGHRADETSANHGVRMSASEFSRDI